LKARTLVTGSVAIATAFALQLSGLSPAFAGDVTQGTVAEAQAAAVRAQAIADEAQRAADKAAERAIAAQLDAQAEADKAAAAAIKAEQTGKEADKKRAEEYAARAATFAAKAAQLQQEANEKAAKAAAAQAAAVVAATEAKREAASFAEISRGVSTEGTATLPDEQVIPANAIKSDNVEVVMNTRGISVDGIGSYPAYPSLNFVHYEDLGYDFLVANGTAGLALWSLKDKENPVYVSKVTSEQLRQPGDAIARFWEGENLTVDGKRKLVYMTRDPRGFGGSTSNGKAGLYIIDIKDPWNPKLLGFHQVPAGHTATCINDCRFVWSVGPAGPGGPLPAGFTGMPVYVTDVRDVAHPFTYPQPLDTGRRDGTTAYVHSVDVDHNGVAWTSGYGGVRGYWTDGKHYDPLQKVTRWATATDPIPYAGGWINTTASNALMHNSYHVPQGLSGRPAGDVILMTHEANNNSCDRAGRFITASIAGSFDGQSWTSTSAKPFRIEKLGDYSPKNDPAWNPNGDCSAHWFTVQGDIVTMAFYEQGVRFLDIADPKNPKLVGWYREPGQKADGDKPAILSSNSSAAYWHDGLVYIADYNRGIDVIKFTGKITGKVNPKVCWNACDK
jgi:hypothetical protein